MGYRSDLTMLFYACDEADFPVFKLWFDENVVPVLREHWNDDEYQPREFERGYSKGYALHFGDIKWYDSYPEVQAIERVWDLLSTTFGQDTETGFAGERVRIGESNDDIERDDTWHSQDLLHIVRHVEY